MPLILALGLAALLTTTAWAQVDPKTALLEREAWSALADGRAAEAAAAFRDALDADPKNARLHLGAALAAFDENRNEDAAAAAGRALALDPALLRAYDVLGRTRHRLGDLRGAIRAFEALTAGGGREEAVATLERWRREAELHDRMQQAIGSHFTVSFEGPEEAALAQEALASLDRAYWRIGQLLDVFPAHPIPVVLYTTQQFADITRSPSWAAGAYDGVIRVPARGAIENGKELDRVLAHEFAHAIVRTLAGRGVPAWLNEGLATALETDAPGEAPAHADAGETIPLADLETSFGRLGSQEASAAYASSARAVRRLIDEAGGFALANLLRDLGDGVDFETAFLHRIQRPFSEFAAETPRH
jgi:tetratricopeptide (TPR) repeat protein